MIAPLIFGMKGVLEVIDVKCNYRDPNDSYRDSSINITEALKSNFYFFFFSILE